MKLKTTLNSKTQIAATLAFPVEFDTETGETEIVGDGRVVSQEETRKRRDLQYEEDPETLDIETLQQLMEIGLIPILKPGETVMLSGVAHVFDVDELDLDDEPMSAEEVTECLVPETKCENRLKTSRRRRRR